MSVCQRTFGRALSVNIGGRYLEVTGAPSMVSAAPSSACLFANLYKPMVSSAMDHCPMPAALCLMLAAMAAKVGTADVGTSSPFFPAAGNSHETAEKTSIITKWEREPIGSRCQWGRSSLSSISFMLARKNVRDLFRDPFASHEESSISKNQLSVILCVTLCRCSIIEILES